MKLKLPALMAGICIAAQVPSYACTGITLKSADGATIAARTIEWAESIMNSLYVVVKHRFLSKGDVPFVDTMEVTLEDPHTLRVSVYEKGILGCFYIDTIGQYAYFDKDGFVVETSTEEIPEVPKITGITCEEVVLYEQLPLEEAGVLGNLLSLTQTLKKYDLLPQEIHYDKNLEPTLTYYDIKVVVGSDDYLTQKVVRMSAILPQLSGLIGTLHLETWTPDTTDIIFERQQ